MLIIPRGSVLLSATCVTFAKYILFVMIAKEFLSGVKEEIHESVNVLSQTLISFRVVIKNCNILFSSNRVLPSFT